MQDSHRRARNRATEFGRIPVLFHPLGSLILALFIEATGSLADRVERVEFFGFSRDQVRATPMFPFLTVIRDGSRWFRIEIVLLDVRMVSGHSGSFYIKWITRFLILCVLILHVLRILLVYF